MKDGDATRSVLIFCSGTVALNRLVTNPTYPGIVADYRKTFARAKDMKVDVLLAPHPEMYKMQEKRAKIADGAPNPFVNPGEFNAYAATLEKAFEEGLGAGRGGQPILPARPVCSHTARRSTGSRP